MATGTSPEIPGWIVIGVLVVLAGVVLISILLSLRKQPPPGRHDSDSDGGFGKDPPPRTPPDAPSGGIPLPDALPARWRMRDHTRLSRRIPSRLRKPTPSPRPERTRTPSRRRIRIGARAFATC